ncbi:oxidoreductase [Sphingomonas sp. ERG5]|uniref:oxidoreductase n=1 Tax=Sphingomonas sp. ERG5 TaxID=1381597 RepID=UPI00054B2DB7|nr:oxidoreductase [Sphingomonas sp. ERG5]
MNDKNAEYRRPSVRVALIGYGFAGRTFHAPLIRATPGLDLALVASRDAAKVHADLPGMAVEADPLRAVTDPAIELVVIAAPNSRHAPLARAALAAGKHVVVDKPFTLDLAEARALIALAEQHDRLLSVFHNRRWDSDYLGVKQLIDSGALGEVVHFESHFDRFRPEVRGRWREQALPGSGVWFDLGPHLVDQALQLFGLPESIQANLAVQRPGGQIDDWAHIVLNHGGRRIVLHAGMVVAGGSMRFTVHGSKASVVKQRADGQERQLLDGVIPGAPGWGEDDDDLVLYQGDDVRRLPTPAGDQRQYYRAIHRALRDGAANPVPPIQALAVMAVIEAATQAATEGRTTRLPLTDAELAAWA